MSGAGSRMRMLAAALVAAAVLLGGQAVADAAAPAGRSSAGRAIGRTGFAYLTGVRTYAAAVLWTRLDPIKDTYYSRTTLGQEKFLLPSIRIVTLLDPQLEDPYYVGPWVLYDGGRKKEAEDLCREGVANNPQSALLHASYAQMLVVERRFTDAAKEADAAVTGKWPSAGDEYSSLPALEIAYDKTGQKTKADAVRRERVRLQELARQHPGILDQPEG